MASLELVDRILSFMDNGDPKSKYIFFYQPQEKNIEPEIIINGNKIDCVNNFNFLGIIINKHLNWNNPIDHKSMKISKVIGILTRLRHTVPIDVLLLLYNSLLLPHINYSLLVWGHNPFLITKLKNCLRIIKFSKIFAHCDPIFKNLRLLKTEDIFKIKHLKYLKNNLPLYFQNLSIKANNHTHDARNQNLYKCRIEHDFAKQSLLSSIPETRNNCTINIKEKLTTHPLTPKTCY